MDLPISYYVFLRSLDQVLALFLMYHLYFGTYSPLKKIVQMWKPIDFFSFLIFRKFWSKKICCKKYFLHQKKFFCAWCLLLKYLFWSLPRWFLYKKIVFNPKWTSLSLFGRKRLTPCILRHWTQKCENWEKRLGQKIPFFLVSPKNRQNWIQSKKILNKE